MLKGNKGEWSEIYTLFKIISDKKLFAGDSRLNKKNDIIYPIIKIFREQSNGLYEYTIEGDIVTVKGQSEKFLISVSSFQENAKVLLSKLLTSTTGILTIPEIEIFINSFNCFSLKAKSTSKSDIRIVIYDHRTNTSPELGFSIKSQLGSASTLLNAGKTTNFIYEIKNIKLTDDQISLINSIQTRNKIKDRIKKIISLSGSLAFVKTESTSFSDNLTLIDSCLPQILSEIVFLFYTSKYSKATDLTEIISTNNPIGYTTATNHPFYSYKIKRFLTDIALGMMPSKVWTGRLDATGGYLIVRDDGEVLCYHIYNRNEFEDYLFENTKFETASSSRHDFGKIYRIDNKLYINLNLQIRFVK